METQQQKQENQQKAIIKQQIWEHNRMGKHTTMKTKTQQQIQKHYSKPKHKSTKLCGNTTANKTHNNTTENTNQQNLTHNKFRITTVKKKKERKKKDQVWKRNSKSKHTTANSEAK